MKRILEPGPAAALEPIDRTLVRCQGRTLVYFGGCDYFRLSHHPAVRRAFQGAVKRFGLNVAASRRTTGNHPLYQELENRLADFFQSESAVLVPNGYLANSAVAQAWAVRFDRAYLDARAHASLRDAARFLDCPIKEFRHRDAGDLERLANRAAGSWVLLTDGLFPHDGSAPPLEPYQRIAGSTGWLLIDDAHAAGVLGENGRGSVEWHRIARRNVVQTVTLSKAFGVYGGAILCSGSLRRRLWKNSPILTASTPIPLPAAAAALVSIGLVRDHPEWRARLQKNVAGVRTGLAAAGWNLPPHPGPIICLAPAGPRHARRLTEELLRQKVFPSCIRYPGGPATGYFRFALSSAHSAEQLEALVSGLAAAAPGTTAVWERRLVEKESRASKSFIIKNLSWQQAKKNRSINSG